MDKICKNCAVLILSPRKADKCKTNDFPEFNIAMIKKYFINSHVYYFYDPVISDGIKNTENKIKDIIRENNISLCFFKPNGVNYELSVDFFKSLKNEAKIRNVLWILDDEMIFDTLSKYYSQVFDAVVTCDYYATFAYQKLGIPSLYFFSSYSKNDLYPVSVSKKVDVSFVGDCTKFDRIEYVNYLKKNGIDVRVFGKGTKNGFVKKEDISKIFSETRINLNFTKVNEPSTYAWFLEENPIVNLVRQNKGRPMEIAMTNSFCLSEYAPSLGITFEIGKEIDIFYDKEDLLKKVRHYLENEYLRIEIANNAYKKAITIYEADIFIPGLLEKLCDVLNNHIYTVRKPVIYKDSIFKKNHINQLTFIMFYQLLKLKFWPSVETFIDLFQYGFGIFLISFFKGTRRAILRVCMDFKKNYT